MRELDFLYSPLLKALAEVKQDKAPAKDWAHILKRLPGVKQIEQQWMQIDDWLEGLAGQQVTREEIMDYVRANQIQLQAFVRGNMVPHVSTLTSEPVWRDGGYDEAESWVDDSGDWDEPTYTINTGDPHEPDKDFIKDQAKDIYYDDLLQEAIDELYEDETEADIDKDEIMQKAISQAEEAHYSDPDYYDATLKSDDDKYPDYEGYYSSYGRDYYFRGLPGRDDGNISADEAISRAKSVWEKGREAAIEAKEREIEEKGLNEELQTREEFDQEVAEWREQNAEIIQKNKEIDEENARLGFDDDATFAYHTMPGGSDYIEIEVILPGLHKVGRNRVDRSEADRLQAEYDEFKASRPDHITNNWESYPGGYDAWLEKKTELGSAIHKLNQKLEKQGKTPFVQRGHFPEENIVVHLRAKTRQNSKGESVLFVEEIQSDLATKHREATENPEVTAQRKALKEKVSAYNSLWKKIRKERNLHYDRVISSLPEKTAAMMRELGKDAPQHWVPMIAGDDVEKYNPRGFGNEFRNEFIEVARQDPEMVRICKISAWVEKREKPLRDQLLQLGTEKTLNPTTPFTPFEEEQTYALASKVALRWAAEKGYSGVAWTPAYMQAERWSKGASYVVESMSWWAGLGGERLKAGLPKELMFTMSQGADLRMEIDADGKILAADSHPRRFCGHHISKFLPPALAREIVSENSGSYNDGKFTMQDSGYTIGYDKQTPKAMDKFVRKFGGKVEIADDLEGLGESPDASRHKVQQLSFEEVADGMVRAGLKTREQMQGHWNIAAKQWPGRSEDFIGDMARQFVVQHASIPNLQAAFPKQFTGQKVWYVGMTPKLREACLEPIPMFRERFLEQDGYVDQFLLEDIRGELQARMEKLGLTNVALTLDAEFEKQGAMFDYGMGELELLIGQTMDPMGTLNHESIHILRQRGLFSRQEWEALAQEAEASWIQKYDIEARYPEASRSLQIEEAIAEAYADHAAEYRNQPIIRRALNKIRVFFNAVSSALGACKVSSPEQVFGMVEAGTVGRRHSKQGQKRDRDLSVPDTTIFSRQH